MIKRFHHVLIAFALVLFGVGCAWASVPDTTYQNTYTTDGITSIYTFTWRLIDPTQMIVQLNGVTQSSSTYTVFQNTNGVGGTVTFNSAPTASETLLIQRQSDLLQLDALPNSGPLPASTLEAMVDKLTIMCQQLEIQITNSGALPVNPARGSLLVGTGTGWAVLAPSAVTSQILTINPGATFGIDWETGSGGGGGGGSGTVNFGSAGQIATYPGNAAAVSGENNLTAAQMLPLSSGQIYQGNASNVVTPTTVSGDVTLSSSGVATLATAGSAGTVTHPTSVTTDAKGRVTAISGGRFVSSQLSLAGSSDINATHGLGVTPLHIWAVLVCTTANGGYSPGDQVVIYPSASASTTNGFNMLADGTTVHMYTQVGGLGITPKTGGAASAITNADWKVELIAEP